MFANGPGDLGSIQRLKKWYLMPPGLTLSIKKYGSRVKWSSPGIGVALSPTPWCCSHRKGSLRVILDYCIYIYIYIYIIIMSCHQHGYPWPSLANSPNYSSPLAGLQGYILCPHIAAVCKFELVVLLLLGPMWGSIGVHHLWARPCFSSSVLRVWFV